VSLCCVDSRDRHSFPTRRSSDLAGGGVAALEGGGVLGGRLPRGVQVEQVDEEVVRQRAGPGGEDAVLRLLVVGAQHAQTADQDRSEEHTSELQSRENLVCRLLLE